MVYVRCFRSDLPFTIRTEICPVMRLLTIQNMPFQAVSPLMGNIIPSSDSGIFSDLFKKCRFGSFVNFQHFSPASHFRFPLSIFIRTISSSVVPTSASSSSYPAHNDPLLQRNLIYTAVTRGRELVVMVGTKKALAISVKNDKTQKRFTYLKYRLE